MYCEFDACRMCCETYLLSEPTPKCMRPDCDKEWTRKFMREQFTNVFLTKKYKDHLEQVLFDQEKALMPATQPLVEEKIRKIALKNQLIELDNLILNLQHQRNHLSMEFHQPGGFINYDENQPSKPGRQFVRQCPAEGCRGFLSTLWKCGICEQWTCPECHELKGPTRDGSHTCNPDNVATAKLLANDSKPCPKCQSLIFKISGCDQMWCTQCHVAFSWKTGHLQKQIHNPHYYEWQRNHNGVVERAVGDVECGRELNNRTMKDIYTLARRHDDLCKRNPKYRQLWAGNASNSEYLYSDNLKTLEQIVRWVIHNQLIELPRFQTDYVLTNQELRIDYLHGSISEEIFKRSIQRNDKRNRKNMEIAQIFQLVITAFTDIVFRLMDDLKTSANLKHHLDDHLAEIQELIKYCNDGLRDISFTYHSIQYIFTDTLKFTQIETYKRRLEKDESATP